MVRGTPLVFLLLWWREVAVAEVVAEVSGLTIMLESKEREKERRGLYERVSG
jgi:hypothetical protein